MRGGLCVRIPHGREAPDESPGGAARGRGTLAPLPTPAGYAGRGLPWAEFSRQKFGGEGNAAAAFSRVSAVGEQDGAGRSGSRGRGARSPGGARRRSPSPRGPPSGRELVVVE